VAVNSEILHREAAIWMFEIWQVTYSLLKEEEKDDDDNSSSSSRYKQERKDYTCVYANMHILGTQNSCKEIYTTYIY